MTSPCRPVEPAPRADGSTPNSGAMSIASAKPGGQDGRPMLVAVSMLYEDAHNPRTEFPEAELEELAEDIRQRGILQPLVVHPVDSDGRYHIHFGAKRLRAAIRAGLQEVPVVVRDLPADRYAQVAENQKRHGLTPARTGQVHPRAGRRRRFERDHRQAARHEPDGGGAPSVAAGSAAGARRRAEVWPVHLTSHVARTAQVARRQPRPGSSPAGQRGRDHARRRCPLSVRASDEAAPIEPLPSSTDKWLTQANAACDRLERALSRIKPPDTSSTAAPELIALRSRVEGITTRWLQGSDRQTPSQAER